MENDVKIIGEQKHKYSIVWAIIFAVGLLVNILYAKDVIYSINLIFTDSFYSGSIFNVVGTVLVLVTIPIFIIFFYKIICPSVNSIFWIKFFLICLFLINSIGVFPSFEDISSQWGGLLIFALVPFVIFDFSIFIIYKQLNSYFKESTISPLKITRESKDKDILIIVLIIIILDFALPLIISLLNYFNF